MTYLRYTKGTKTGETRRVRTTIRIDLPDETEMPVAGPYALLIVSDESGDPIYDRQFKPNELSPELVKEIKALEARAMESLQVQLIDDKG